MRKAAAFGHRIAIFAMALQLLFPMGYMPGESFWITVCPAGLPDGMLQISAEHEHHLGNTEQSGQQELVESQKHCSLSGSIVFDSSFQIESLITPSPGSYRLTLGEHPWFIQNTPTGRLSRAPPLSPA